MGVEYGYTTEFAGEYTMIGPGKSGDHAGRNGNDLLRRFPEERRKPIRSLEDDLIIADVSRAEYNNREPDLKGSGLIAGKWP
jgi:hypothetical protein